MNVYIASASNPIFQDKKGAASRCEDKPGCYQSVADRRGSKCSQATFMVCMCNLNSCALDSVHSYLPLFYASCRPGCVLKHSGGQQEAQHVQNNQSAYLHISAASYKDLPKRQLANRLKAVTTQQCLVLVNTSPTQYHCG